MSRRFHVFVLALSLAACGLGGPSQSAPQSEKAQTPQQSSPPAADALQPPKPEAAPNASSTPAGEPARVAEAQPKPQFREVTVPTGTPLRVTLDTPIASDSSQAEDVVRGRLTEAIVINGVTVVPEGTEVSGTVRDAKRSGRVKGRALVSFQFERLNVRGESVAIRTATVSRQAAANRRDDVEKGAIGGAAGAIVGGLVGGGKGAAIGAGVGATGAVVATRGDEVRLNTGTMVRTTLREPLKIVVPLR